MSVALSQNPFFMFFCNFLHIHFLKKNIFNNCPSKCYCSFTGNTIERTSVKDNLREVHVYSVFSNHRYIKSSSHLSSTLYKIYLLRAFLNNLYKNINSYLMTFWQKPCVFLRKNLGFLKYHFRFKTTKPRQCFFSFIQKLHDEKLFFFGKKQNFSIFVYFLCKKTLR